MTSPLHGGPDDLRDVLTAFESRTSGIEALTHEVGSLVAEVTALRVAVGVKPSRSEVDRKRRKTALALVLYGVLLMFATDQHTEHCGPGARAEAVLRAIATTPVSPSTGVRRPLTLDRITQIIEDEQPSALCDAVFPLHGHLDGSYPGGMALVGLFGYGGALVGLYAWAQRPWERRSRDEVVVIAAIEATKAAEASRERVKAATAVSHDD